jgi:hypothetical protein
MSSGSSNSGTAPESETGNSLDALDRRPELAAALAWKLDFITWGKVCAHHGREPRLISRTEAALARKANGGRLGDTRNIAHAGELGREVEVSAADEFAEKILPAVNATRLAGAKTLDAISCALNEQGIRTARGKRWPVSSVANLLARAKTLAEAR